MKITTLRISFWILAALALLAVTLSACEARISRNEDGTYTLETTISEADMQAAIKASLADPLIQELDVDLRSGYITVSGTRKRLNSDQTDTLSFRLDLGASGGLLTATISDALLDGAPIEADRVALWNERIANRLSNTGGHNSSLQAVSVTENAVTLTWIIEGR
jgi:hypothetical protein